MAGESLDLFQSMLNSEDKLAAVIASNWKEWYTAKNTHLARVAEVKEYLYATSTEETSNSSNEHSHKTNIPKITQIYDNLKANYMSGLIPGPNWFVFEGEDSSSITTEKRNKIEAYLRTKHRLSKFNNKLGEFIDDWLIDGNCFAGVTYKNESHTLPDGKVVPGYKGPDVFRIAPNDIVFNPTASNFRSSPKIIRTVKSFGELARDIQEKPELKYEKSILDRASQLRAFSSGISVEDMTKFSQYSYDGFGSITQYLKSGFVEILDFYGDIFDIENMTLYKNHVITVVDKLWVARNEPIDTYNGYPNIFHAGYRKRADNLWHMGPLANLVGMQYKINHLENARADGFDEMLMPDRVIVGDVEDVIEDETGRKTYYISSERGGVSNLPPDQTVLTADMQIRETEEKMELFAGAPREGVGVRSPGEKTKFEVSTLENSRGRPYQYKLAEFESQFLEDILNSQIALSRKYLLLETDTARVDDPNSGVKLFIDISSEDLVANGQLRAQGARHYAKQAQLAQSLQMFSQIAAQDPELQQHFPTRRLAKLWEDLLEFSTFELVEEYGRIPERLAAQRLMAVAQQKLAEEQATPVDDLSEPEDINE